MAITLEYRTVVRATPDQVWEKFSDVSQWRRYNPAIHDVHWLSGEPWQPGSRLAMDLVQPRPLTLESTLDEVRPPVFVRLRGKMMGVSADQSFAFILQPDGTTEMRTVQVLTGAATMFINENMKQAATRTFANWFESMKRDVESA